MILIGTILDVIDNSGVLKLLCVGKFKRNLDINVGDIIIGVVKRTKKNSLIKISSIVRALVVTSKKYLNIGYGDNIKFTNNCVIILSKKNVPIGTRAHSLFYYKNFYYDSLKLQSINIK